MNYPYYELSVPVFTNALKNLQVVLSKGEAYIQSKKISDEVLLNDRLIADMFPLVKQVQVSCDNAKGSAARLAGVEIPKMVDNEKTFAELSARIDKTLVFLETLKPEQFEGAADRKIILPYFPDKHLLGKDYLPTYALPNFFFHVTTAYNILRKNGVEIGKRDFIGTLPMFTNDQ